MPEREGGNHERERFEAWQQDLFGEFERLHWQADELRHRLNTERFPAGVPEVEELFDRLHKAYAVALKQWESRSQAIPLEVRQSLRETFEVYHHQVEEWFGRPLG
ncbi:MAG: hypothetical protein HY567_03165 [Candidatus Kerfeldbacteria bacterium]|nr:hypothetical protein [Candidatus Kerfeldbacteria bacterium]